MSDYLGNLAARALGLTVTARPRPSFFEPRRDAVEPVAPADEVAAVERRAPPPLPPALLRPAAPEPSQEPDDRQAREPVLERPEPTRPLRRERRAREPALARRPAAEEPPPPARPPTRRPKAPAPPLSEPVEGSAELPSEPRPPRPVRAERPLPLLAAKPPRPAVGVKESGPPTVRVTIGRVDVRAVTPEEPPAPKPKPRPAPRMSLDEYLSRERSSAQ